MNIIVTTTINKPTKAILKFANLKSWHLIVVADKKHLYKIYLDNDINMYPTF